MIAIFVEVRVIRSQGTGLCLLYLLYYLIHTINKKVGVGADEVMMMGWQCF